MYGLRFFGFLVCRILLIGGRLDFSCWSLFCFVVALVHISLWSPKWTLVPQVPLPQVVPLSIGLVIWCLKLYIKKLCCPPLFPPKNFHTSNMHRQHKHKQDTTLKQVSKYTLPPFFIEHTGSMCATINIIWNSNVLAACF